MNTTEDESHPAQGREKEESILFLVDMLCMIGAMVSIFIGIDYLDSVPNAWEISLSVALFLFGFIFERGALSSQMSSRLRERIWWVGPISFFGMILLYLSISGTLFAMTIDDIGLIAFAVGFWIVGAGLKRLLVRGRFEQAYRGMVARKEESKFILNWKSLFLPVVFITFVVIINLISFTFNYEHFREDLAASVIFIIFVIVLVASKTDKARTQSAKTSEFE